MKSPYQLIFVSLLSVFVAAFFSGCGGDETSTSSGTGTSASSSNSSKKTAPTEESKSPESKSSSKESAGGGTGTLVGVIKFKGDLPELPPLIKQGDVNAKDAEVCAANDVPDESLVINAENKGIANVFIYLRKAPDGAAESPVSTDPLVLDQKGCRYIPHAAVFQAGRPVKAISSDKVSHNVHSVPVKNDAVNQIIQPGDKDGLMLDFSEPESVPVQVKCDIHAWMLSWQFPLDHPYGAVTDADGRFEIANLPAGTHEFRIWQERPGYLERSYEVTIKSGETTEIQLEYAMDKFQK